MFLTTLFLFPIFSTPVLALINYNYDQNGNMISEGTFCYTYNDANRVSKVKNCGNNQAIAEYVYDYQGNRIVKKLYSNGTLDKTVYSPNTGYETVKLPDNSKQNTSYYFLNDELVAKKNPDGNKFYYLTDHLQSTRVLTAQNGGVIENTHYYPFGEIRSGGTTGKYLYTGQENDSETNLFYYDSRYYNPHIQRFAQPDQLLPNIYDPQQLNRYAYTRNNPLKYTDSSGHFLDFALDITFISWDLKDIKDNPNNLYNYAALAADVGGLLLPGFTGGGRAVKALEHGADVAKAVDKGIDTAKGIKTFAGKSNNIIGTSNDILNSSKKGINNPIVKSAVDYGKEMHLNYKADDVLEGVRIKEFRDIKGIRPDFVDLQTKTIYELKPNNERAINRGMSQLENYKTKMEQSFGGVWKTILETYSR